MAEFDGLSRDLAAILREQARIDRFGIDAACSCCGDTTLIHLNRLAERDICGCCLAIVQGKRAILEGHHLAGHSEGPVVLVCGNCHLELTELQRGWPENIVLETRLELGLSDLVAVRRRHTYPGV